MKEHTKRSIESLALSIVALVGLDAREAMQPNGPPRCARCDRVDHGPDGDIVLRRTISLAGGATWLNLCKMCRLRAFREIQELVSVDWPNDYLGMRELDGPPPPEGSEEEERRNWEGDGKPQNVVTGDPAVDIVTAIDPRRLRAPERWTEPDPTCEQCAGTGLVPAKPTVPAAPCPRCRPDAAAAEVTT